MHHFLHLCGIIHAAAAYHQVGVDVIIAGYAIVGELGEIDVVAFFVSGYTLHPYF